MIRVERCNDTDAQAEKMLETKPRVQSGVNAHAVCTVGEQWVIMYCENNHGKQFFSIQVMSEYFKQGMMI